MVQFPGAFLFDACTANLMMFSIKATPVSKIDAYSNIKQKNSFNYVIIFDTMQLNAMNNNHR